MMTPFRLVVLRLYNLTLGRFSPFSRLLRQLLLTLLIKRSKKKYVQSSQYFSWDQLMQK